MNKAFWLCLACSAGVYAVACSSSNGTSGTQGTSSGGGGHTTSSSATGGATTSSSSTATGTGGTTTSSTSSTSTSSTSTSSTTTSTTTTTSSCTGVTLTVKNYLAWCSVSVNGMTASSASEQTVCVSAGTIPLSATPLSGFELGTKPWHDTAGDTGTGDPGTVSGGADSTTVVVSTGSKCVWVCCETAGTTDCPTTDQCP